MSVSKRVTFDSFVPTIQDAFAFFMDHLDEVGDKPSFGAEFALIRKDEESEWREGFEVVVSGYTEIETVEKIDDFPTLG